MARKRFGQNFLVNAAIIYQIIAAVDPKPDQHIVEIGPGLGALTKALINSGANVDAIEIDRDLIGNLQQLKKDNFKLHNQDVLEFNFCSLAKIPLRLVGNLPYNISTPLMFKVFADIDIISDMHFMLQKEVADRLTAQPNSKTYGKLSVMAQYYCDMEIIVDVPPEAFDPMPKVLSSVVKFTPRQQREPIDPIQLEKIVSTAFMQRRKTIANSLGQLLNKEDLVQLGLDSTLRAENLNLQDYIRLTNYLDNK